jgi:hypothetical protein
MKSLVMPFSKYDVPSAQIEAMRAAFNQVCEALQLNCGVEDPATEIVVLKIVELAKAGEVDPERLCAGVLAGLGARSQPIAGSGGSDRKLMPLDFTPQGSATFYVAGSGVGG